MSAPVLPVISPSQKLGEVCVLFQEGLSFRRVGHDRSLDLPQARFTTFQSTQFDFRCDSGSVTTLDPRHSDSDVLLVGLQSADERVSVSLNVHRHEKHQP